MMTNVILRKALYISLVFLLLILSLTGLAGAVLFQYNKCCDSLKAGHVKNYDQMLPYLSVNIFQDFPGVTGLYIAGAYSGALSTVSSGINSMTTVIITDFIRPYETEFEIHPDDFPDGLSRWTFRMDF